MIFRESDVVDGSKKGVASDAISADDQISLYLGRTYYSYLGMLSRHLKLRGLDKKLRPGIGNLLFALHRSDDLTATDIAKQIGVAKSTVARLVEKVRSLGLVTTRPDPDDGRAVRLSLTPEARSLMPRCFELANHVESVICRGFSPEERSSFAEMLLRATENINQELEALESKKS